MSTTPDSSRRNRFTFFTRASAENARSLRPVRSGSFSCGRTSSQGRVSG